MAVEKRTPAQQRRIDDVRAFIRTVEHVRKMVAELESNRAARSPVIDNICAGIARELSQLRQRALSANIGTLADTAGSLAVLAGRGGGGVNLKIRGLTDGVHNMMTELDQALKHALAGEKKEP
ncbi:MAG TPA: hypothetical protein VNI61_01840 [Gemmatimonadales bacterium]|nr:hypothetical protein [Gemmatimonadales bacterium]